MEASAVWSRSARPWLDGALIASIVAVGWGGMIAARSDADVFAAQFSVGMAVVAVLATLPVWWRRQYPLAMLAASAGGVVLAGAIDPTGLFGPQIALLAAVLLFAIGAWSTRLVASLVVVVGLVGLVVAGALADDVSIAAAVAYALALIGLPSVVGYAMRTRRQYVAEVEARLAAAERDRDEAARRAVEEERQRIARELHDVVAHHVSLIGVQAGAARSALDRSPDRARQALLDIEASSRAAVGEMRQLLGVLAPLDGVAPPQPGLDAIPALVERWRSAGLLVEATLIGDPTVVAPTVSTCVYRIVEEALTNVSRHSGAGCATVSVHVGRTVDVSITDAGPARTSPAEPGSGRGLVGMRERVASCGGSLAVGRQPDGSFAVRASVPVVPT